METDYTNAFSSIKILSDTTDGLIELETVKRYNQDRSTKVKNNFVGQLTKTSSKTLLQIVELLNQQLPKKTEREVIVGLMTSGIVLSAYLALVRDSFFNYSIHSKFSNYENSFSFTEDHRNDKKHYLYGIKPGDEVIIIDDEITSGNGVTTFTKELRNFDITTKAIACIIETTNFCAREKILEQTGLNLQSLVQIELVK